MKNTLLWLLVPFVIAAVCCSGKKEEATTYLPKVNEVNSLSDTVFFGWIRDMDFYDDTLYLADQAQNRVLVADKDFNFIRYVGKPGPGPFEIKGMQNVEVSDNAIYLNDITGGKILRIDRFTDEISSINTRSLFAEFDVDDSHLFYADPDIPGSPPILQVNTESNKQERRFGELQDESLQQPEMHTLVNDQHIISVYRENSFRMDVYDKKGDLLNTVDLGQYGNLSEWVESLQIERVLTTNTVNVRHGFTLARDVFLTKKRLYVLPSMRIIDGIRFPVLLLSFRIDEQGKLFDEKIINIHDGDEGSFYCIAVSSDDKLLYGFDPALGSIKTFDLSEAL